MTSELFFPMRGAAQPDSWGISAKSINRWLGEKPSNNPAQQVRRLYAAIAEVNRTEMPMASRRAATDALYASAKTALDYLRGTFSGSPSPLSDKKHRNALLYLSLLREFAYAFKLLLWPILNGSESTNAQTDSDLQQTVYFHARYIEEASLIHLKYPRLVWRDLNRLLRQALHRNLINFDAPAFRRYLKCLLLVAGNPYRFNWETLQLIIEHCDQWATHCQILHAIDAKPAPGLINPLNCRPFARAEDDTLEPGEATLLLDARKLIELAPHDDESLWGNLTPTVRRKLAHRWNSPTPTAAYRYAPDKQYSLVDGMEAIFYYMGGAHLRDERTTPDLRGWSHTNLSLDAPVEHTEFDPGASGDNWSMQMADAQENMRDQERRVASSSGKSKPSVRSATSIAVNSQELGLRFSPENSPAPAINRLVAFELSGENSGWILGRIAWYRVAPDRQIEIGVEHLCDETQECKVRYMEPNTNHAVERAALLYHALEDDHSTFHLVLPPGEYAAGSELSAHNDQLSLELAVERILSHSGSHALVRAVKQKAGADLDNH
jgi:hypothetical protein